MLKIASQPLTFGRTNGATWSAQFVFADPDGESGFAAGNVPSGKISWTGGELALTIGNGRLAWVDEALGWFRIAIAPADYASIPNGDASQLWLYTTDSGGAIDAFAMYPMRIVPGPA